MGSSLSNIFSFFQLETSLDFKCVPDKAVAEYFNTEKSLHEFIFVYVLLPLLPAHIGSKYLLKQLTDFENIKSVKLCSTRTTKLI